MTTTIGLAVIAIVGGTVHTGNEVIEGGVVILDGGKIAKVGRGLAPPPGAEIVDARGAIVTAGFTDPQTQVGLLEIDQEEETRDDHQIGGDRVRAAFRAADGYNPASTVIPVTRAEGVTSVVVVPSGGMVSGQSAWADLDGASAATLLAPLAIHARLHPDDHTAGGQATALLRLREALDDARAFKSRRAAWEKNQSRPFAPSRLDLEALGLAEGGKVPVVFHVNRASDILSALAVAREFKLRPVIAGGAEAWQVTREIVAAKAPVIVMPLVNGPENFHTLGAREDNAALLHKAGVAIALSTGDTHNARKLRQVAGNAVRAGLPHAAALLAVTRAPADAFGLGARYGTLAPGKVANVVVWSGDPFELSTAPRAVFIRGQRASLRSRQTVLLEKYRKLGR